jgi:hypothetical protein
VADKARRTTPLLELTTSPRVGGVAGGIASEPVLLAGYQPQFGKILTDALTVSSASLGRVPDFGIKAEMAAGWRAKLDMSALATQRSVAAEMASAITNAKIQGLTFGSRPFLADTIKALELSLPKVETRLLLGGLAAQLEGTLGRIAADLQKRLEPVALLAVKGFAEQMESTFKRTTAYREALLAMGWWFPPSMPMSWFVEAGKRASAGDRVGVRRYMNDIAASDYFERVLEDRWMNLDVFRRRRRFLRDGLEDHLSVRLRPARHRRATSRTGAREARSELKLQNASFAIDTYLPVLRHFRRVWAALRSSTSRCGSMSFFPGVGEFLLGRLLVGHFFSFARSRFDGQLNPPGPLDDSRGSLNIAPRPLPYGPSLGDAVMTNAAQISLPRAEALAVLADIEDLGCDPVWETIDWSIAVLRGLRVRLRRADRLVPSPVWPELAAFVHDTPGLMTEMTPRILVPAGERVTLTRQLRESYRTVRSLGAPIGLELLAIEGLIDALASRELVNGIGGSDLGSVVKDVVAMSGANLSHVPEVGRLVG